MRLTAAVFTAVFILAGIAHADPAPQALGPDVVAALRQLRSGQTTQGRESLDRLARAGQADAAEALGELLQSGQAGLPADPAAACRYFALGQGLRGDTTHNLALCYEQGVIGGPPDPTRAATLYQQAADLGFGKSKCALGNLLRNGRGVARDEPRGLALCKEAAEAGYADAQTDMGDAYLMGQGVPADVVKARRWYEKAAVQNQRNALFTLGQIYWNGDGVTKDNAVAARLWRSAYAAGRLDAAKFPGDDAFLRAGVSKGVWTIDGLEEARGWYEKGAAAETPEFRAQALERAALAEQLKGVMQRRQP